MRAPVAVLLTYLPPVAVLLTLQVRAPVAGLGRARRARARLDAAGPDAGRHSQRRQRPQPQCTHHAVLVGVGGDQRGAAPQHLDRCGRVFPYERRAAVPMRIQPRRVCGKLLRSPLAWFIWRLAHARGFSSHKGYPEGKLANKALLPLKRLKRQRWHEELDTHHKSLGTHKQSTPRAGEGLPAGAARLGRAALQNHLGGSDSLGAISADQAVA